jgi:putative addiction module component (TIGR02574 family)
MTVAVKKVFENAMDLQPIERAELIENLFFSFDQMRNQAIDDAWVTEVESRFAAYDAGKLTATAFEDVMARIRER